MSDVTPETTNKQSGLTSALILGGTAIAAIYTLPVVLPLVFGHLIATAVLGGAAAAGAYFGTNDETKEKAKGFFSKIGKAYKDAVSNAFHGFRNAEKWANDRAAARTAAPAADEGTSPLAGKEAANDFGVAATGAKVKVSAPAPAAKPTAAPKM
jgi:hypothetical protein